MAQISLNNLCFSYEGRQDKVFDNFSTSFDTCWRLGLIARNGRGKTTLLRLISKELYPTGGSVNTPTGMFTSIFPPRIDFSEYDSSRSIVRRLMPDLEDWELMRELSLLEADNNLLEQNFTTLSPGEQGKIFLAALFANENSYVLLDEPGNHLDAAGKKILSNYLSAKKGFLLVSHERILLDEVTDHSMALLKSGPEIVAGPYHVWAEHRKNLEKFELAENIRLEKEISKLGESTLQSGQWANKAHRNSRKDDGSGIKFGLKEKNRAKAAKLERRAKQAQQRKEKAAEEKGRLLNDIEENANLNMNPLYFHSDFIVNAVNLSLRYGNKSLLHKVSFTIQRGDRLCLLGNNGAGKSTLLNLIANKSPSENLVIDGDLYVYKGLKISILPQLSDLPPICLMDYINQKGLDATKILMLLRKMDFPREAFQSIISSYSSGQKRKLLLALSLSQEAHLYIWDEPLNYLDIQTREQIEGALLDAKPTLVFTEHDEYFCKKIATKNLNLLNGLQEYL